MAIQKSSRFATSLTHGHTVGYKATPTYKSWKCLRYRCYGNGIVSKRYRDLGISVCERWRNSFPNFLADMGERPPGTTIDRINNYGNYELGNCRWATHKQQQRNRSSNTAIEWRGQTKTISEWSEITGLNRDCLSYRIEKGWPVEKAMTLKPMTKKESASIGGQKYKLKMESRFNLQGWPK